MIFVSESDAHDLTLLADHLASRKSHLMKTWISSMRAHPSISSTDSMTRQQLADHLPLLFENLVARLRTAKLSNIGEPGPEARKHGGHRWRQGYRIEELFNETRLLRSIVTQHLFLTFGDRHPDFSREEENFAKEVIQDFFDRLVAQSVEQYVDEQQRQIREFTLELEKHNQHLTEANQSRIELMRSVSHELRNSLEAQRVILAVVGKGNVRVEGDDLLEIAQRNLNEMGFLLNQLLDYSALVAGQDTGEQKQFSAREFFDELVSTWSVSMREAGVKFESKFDANLDVLTSDRQKLGQIARNLLSNAVKFQPKGRPGKAGLMFTRIDDERWRLSVWDEGIGIADQDISRLFKEFSRISPQEGVGGSGLGLAITRQLVELLGGRIDVTSKVGEGTRFDVNLPLKWAD